MSARMDIQSAFPLNNKDQLLHWLRATLPRYTYTTRAGVVIVGSGASTGVMIKTNGPHHGSLGWALPSMGVQLLLTLGVFAGILPGLLVWLLVWLAVKGDVEKIKHDLAQHLATGGASAQQQPQGQWGGQGGYGPGQSGPGQGGYGAPPQLQQGPPQYDMQHGAPQLQQGMQQQGMPQLQQGMQQGGMAPGSQVMVATPDGQQHPATLVQEAQGQCQCRFQNGHEQWYPSSSVRPA